MTLEIYLLGQFRLQANECAVEIPSRPAQSLLAYLALNPGMAHRREKLASLLWSDASESNARGYLRQALWRIRKSLESCSLDCDDYLETSDISVTFKRSAGCWLDADELLKPAEKRSTAEIKTAIKLYKGELLPGFYDEWIVLERDRLQAAYRQLMNQLIDRLIQKNAWEEVLQWGEEWIRLDYSPEPAYRALMTAHARLGNLGMIGATYQRCVEALERDLGMEPSPETTRLYEQIRGGGLEDDPAPIPILAQTSGRLPAFLTEKRRIQAEKPVFVARERELKDLDGHLNQALKGRGRVVFITGEAGSGKTTLADEFTRRAQQANPGLIAAQGRCNAHIGVGDPYLPFREILELLTGDVEARWNAGAIPTENARFLWDLIPTSVQALLEVGPGLVDTLLSGEALYQRASLYEDLDNDLLEHLERFIGRKTAASSRGITQQIDLLLQYCKVLQALAMEKPLLILVDDLQWADLGSINLLFQLGRGIAGSRILVIGAYRPEEVAAGRSGERHPLAPVVNELKRLSGTSAVNVDQVGERSFIDELLDSEPNLLDSSFREMLYEQTQGHPLFTVELLRGMQERGDMVLNPQGLWIAGSALDWETLPARVEAVIAERIGRLDPRLQDVLRAASVEGETFTAEVVARAIGHDEEEVLAQLSQELDKKHRLVRAQSIQRLSGKLISSYRFRHFVVQKYQYSSLDEVEKVHLHERVGTALEELYSQPGARFSIAPQLARHFQEARIADQAISYLIQAGERALYLSAYQEAIAHLTRGLEWLKELPDPKARAKVEVTLQFDLGKAWEGVKGNPSPEIEAALKRALEVGKELDEKSTICLVQSSLSIVHFVKGDHRYALDLAEQASAISRQSGDPLLEAVVNLNLGVVLYALGDYSSAENHLNKMLNFYQPEKHHEELLMVRGVDYGLTAMAYRSCCLWLFGYPDQALQQARIGLDLAREYNHSFTLVDVTSYGGFQLSRLMRDTPAMRDYADQMIHVCRDKSFLGWLWPALTYKGEALIRLGEIHEGIALIQQGLKENLAMGLTIHIPRTYLTLVDAYIRLDDREQARSALEKAHHYLIQTDEMHWESSFYRSRARWHIYEGDLQAAKQDLFKSLEVARRQKAKSWELQSAIDLARLWQGMGKAKEAREMLSEIYSWFTEGFNTPDLIAAKALLDSLA